MRTLVIALAVYTGAMAALCALLYATRSSWRGSSTGVNILAVTAGFAALIICLLVNLAWRVPTWVYALIFADLAPAFTQRAWLMWRAQQKERADVES